MLAARNLLDFSAIWNSPWIDPMVEHPEKDRYGNHRDRPDFSAAHSYSFRWL